jgi:hypothetical protein
MSQSPGRIEDLLELKRQGFDVTCEPVFEIIPVDFTQRNFAYQAYVFVRYGGTISKSLAKCYAGAARTTCACMCSRRSRS